MKLPLTLYVLSFTLLSAKVVFGTSAPAVSEDSERISEAIDFKETNETRDSEDEEQLGDMVVSFQSEFQKMEIYEYADIYGSTIRQLYIEGALQSSTQDEFIYHESLVHPVMLAHPEPKRVAVLGGGEGATLKTVLTHSTVEVATMVELDKAIVDFSKEYLTEMCGSAFDDPRAELKFQDAFAFVKNMDAEPVKYDVVIMDIVDPEDIVYVNNSAAAHLYSNKFFKFIAKRTLNPDGVFVMQAGEMSLTDVYHKEKFEVLESMLKYFFKVVIRYMVYVPSFGAEWSFLLCCHRPEDCERITNFETSYKHVFNELKNRNIPPESMRFYDHESHQRIMSMPPGVRGVGRNVGKDFAFVL